MSSATKELIERIGACLPTEIRAAYYREMLYFQSLPENDELLRILRVLQILTMLIEQVPDRIAKERERVEKLLAGMVCRFEQTFQTSKESLEQLDRRLEQLPGYIAASLSPKSIVTEINANLRNELARSTLPQTTDALREAVAKISEVSSEFGTTADSLGSSYRGAAEKARRAISDMNESIADAAQSASRAAKDLTSSFNSRYWWSVLVLTSVALVLGFAAGIMVMR